MDDIEDGCFVNELGGLTLAAEVLFKKAEIVLVGDEAVLVLVDDLEGDANVGLLGCEFDEREGIIDGLYELGKVHDALVAAVIEFFAVQALDGNLSEVLFHAEVNQLVVLDASIAIVVVPEDVFDEVLHLGAILPQHLLQKVPYFILLELLVPVLVEFNQPQVHHLSHLERQFVRGKLETLQPCPSRLQFYEFASLFLTCPTACQHLSIINQLISN